jgi:DNA-binding XRE family transcriptional regulator
MARRPNPRRIKIHRNYTVDELARAVGAHKNTIRAWIKQGLAPVDEQRPTLILGRVAMQFLSDRRKRGKRPCSPGQLYCVRCRAPKKPALKMAEYVPMSTTLGNLRGFCPDCEAMMNRRVALAKLDAVRGDLEIPAPQAQRRIGDSTVPSANCDSGKER